MFLGLAGRQFISLKRTARRNFVAARKAGMVLLALYLGGLASAAFAQEPGWPAKTSYRYQVVEGRKIFFREAGDASKPTIVLLHGFPSTSHAYRELIPLLSGKYHVIAPDYLGSGYSDHPDPDQTTYTFDLLAKYVAGLTTALGLEQYSLYVWDFGAPVGYRLMLQQPQRLKALIVQSGNAYAEGLSDARLAGFRKSNQDRSPENVAALYARFAPETIINGTYLRDVKGREAVMSPDAWTSDLGFLQTEKDKKIQVQLLQDYYNNISAYPQWQAFLRKQQPPTLIVWGERDPVFIAAGARAYLKDVPAAELHLIDAGHFAVEEKPAEIAGYILAFLEKVYKPRQ